MKRRAENRGSESSAYGGIGLLASMLIIISTALLTCVLLAGILFAAVGTRFYAGIKADELIPQTLDRVGATRDYLYGKSTSEEFHWRLRSADTFVVVLDVDGDEIAYANPQDNGNGSELLPPGIELSTDGFGSKYTLLSASSMELSAYSRINNQRQDEHSEYVGYCRNCLPAVLRDGEYVRYITDRCVIVGLRVDATNGTPMAAVFMLKPVDDIQRSTRSIIFALSTSIIIVVLTLLLPTYLATRIVASPVKKMSEAALKLADGDFDVRVDVKGSYEIRKLGTSFNTLADKLQDNIGSLVVERNRLRAVLDGLREGIIAVDTNVDITHFNSSSVRLLGGKPGDMPDVLSEYAYVKAVISETLENNREEGTSFKCGERLIHIKAEPIHEENGSIAGAVALLSDVTEAERLEQTRKDYVANVSHELRTPLASIRGIADMLNDGLVKKEEDRKKYYGYMLHESMRLSTLINDLLELSRLQSGSIAIKKIRFDLYELIMDVADRMNEDAKLRGMILLVKPCAELLKARSNPDRVEQVLVSLVDNAIKHGEANGEVIISVEAHEGKWHISVENKAKIDPNSMDHLFERFYKADIAHTGEGTGLGLAIVEEVLRVMNEKIDVDYDGKIIRFTFTVDAETQ